MSGVLLVDGNNILTRAVHAAKHAHMSVDGVNTGSLLIFINMLSRHIREEQPDSVVVCWDGGRSVYRTTLYPGYKAARKERPDEEDEDRPFGQAKEFLTLAGIHHVERAGWEADDLIACYWRSIRPVDERIVILSADKDLLQMVGHNCEQVRPTTPPNPTDRWDAEKVFDKYGVQPGNLSKAMAMIGDISDGVPGIKGIGPVKAAKLVNERSWEELLATRGYENLDLWHRLIDLRSISFHALGLSLQQPPPFRPTGPTSMLYIDLSHFLDRYALESVKTRLLTGGLWSEQEVAGVGAAADDQG